MHRFSHISLFSGAMGLDLGLEQAGFETLAFVELDPIARQTIHINLSRLGRNATVFEDVTQVTAQDLLDATNLRVGEVTLVSGGPPCQPFSTAGRRAAIQDPRGSLFRDFIRLIEGIRPRFFVMENVRGILSAAIRHRPIAERGKEARPLEPDELPGSAFQVILDEFTRLGYSYVYGLLNAANYGVPQIRERVIIIGSRDHEPVALPQPTHSRSGIGLPKWRTLREALANLSDPEPQFPPYPDSRLRFLQLIPEGGNWRNLPRELLPEAMGGALNSGGGKVGFYRRLAWDKPSPTITTSPAQKATDMCHPSELRPISVREAARIQGFPDDWIFYGSMADQYRQIGNAVPPRLGKAIGDSIVATIMGEKKATAIQTRLFELAS
ncbi:DNA cytosine methyltransferase [Meiothermus sp. CFH 77666]|uniref:DNA cytosine methyltransferase n=1 Tax=Meiothermus sp. CFH 77666 TaxID=2817942 RepID=UPI001AA0293D|nr:DNA cytosine methyltransferase [Meiothermus sp. CFH 77666]MBO1436942.1 DNA cytosine methyltransferase [Meiothermus sp. CFH 77666]